ncbi:hypothetical protein [Rathayibacter sp. Leaf248]|uniref:hypothetical protein n=1 Tax=Rathayibacter sp. Leaf248 TaxID=2876555 RepID=UPI001E54B692|nr:hypothetical protein [Rathayibacter sp. Leaf248]
MIERQKTETTAEVYAEEELVRLRMHRKRTGLAPAEARQLAQELNDAADEAEGAEPSPAPVPLRQLSSLTYYDIPSTAIPYDEGA